MFEQLDFIYMPSRDAADDVRYLTDVLGARLVFVNRPALPSLTGWRKSKSKRNGNGNGNGEMG